jgi:hypothetical protein
MSFDQRRTWELAKAFCDDQDPPITEREKVDELAQFLQDQMEDWLEDEKQQ